MMDSKIQQEVSRQLTRRFTVQMAVYTMVIIVVSVIGYRACASRIWYEGDFLYPVIRVLHDHWFTFFLLALFVGCMMIAYVNFYKTAEILRQIIAAVNGLYTDRSETVSLPKNLRDVENQLNQIRLDEQLSRQAAHEAEQRKNDMIMYMAHDLKTPLTSIIGYLTLIFDEPDISEPVRNKYVGIALKKALRLEDLINEFFEITRFNFSHMTLEYSSVNMSVMVEQILYEFQPMFDQKGLNFRLDTEPNIYVSCDVEKMERVFDNLFKNVVNYSYQNTEILVSLGKNGDKGMKLTVENHGRTIPREKLEHLFEQFFRMDSSRATGTGGSGLGLAVVKEIINLHHGTVICESENEIVRFVITI